MSGEIFYTDEFGEWFADLSADDQDAVAHLVELLGQKWLALGHPYSSEIKGSRYALRELRSQKRKPIRVVYAFSPERNAVLLIGGDKTGNPRFYDEITPRAETIWERYLRERRFFDQDSALHWSTIAPSYVDRVPDLDVARCGAAADAPTFQRRLGQFCRDALTTQVSAT
jgi:hypothetical protein